MVVEAGEKITPRRTRKLIEDGVKELLVTDEGLVSRYVAVDLIDENTGLILAEAGDELNEELVVALREAGVHLIPTLDVDHVTVGAFIRNTLMGDKNSTREHKGFTGEFSRRDFAGGTRSC